MNKNNKLIQSIIESIKKEDTSPPEIKPDWTDLQKRLKREIEKN